MPHIAVVISGLTGRMHSGFELISRLRNEGHRVTCLCQPYTTDNVAKQGFDYLEIPEINFKYVGAGTMSSRGSWFQKWKRHLSHKKHRYEIGKKALGLADYEKIWSEVKPDAVLIDVELHDLIFTAYAAKIPIHLFHTWFSDTSYQNMPPIRTRIVPGKGFDGSTLGIAWARFVDRLKIQGRFCINMLRFQEYRRATLKQYAREIGFPLGDLRLSTLPPLYSFKKLPILLLTMQELDFKHRPNKNLTYVGPMIYENRIDFEKDSQDAIRLNSIFEDKRKYGKKLIYCSVSSFVHGDASFLKRVIQAVTEETNWILVVSTGGRLSKESFGSLSDNMYIFEWLPQLEMLEHADCSINHGGVNSVNECLHFSVPMLIYSGGMFDQNGNTARMGYHGLAIVGDKNTDGPAEIRKNIAEVLIDPTYKQNMSKYHEIYNLYRGQKLSPLLFKTVT